jgi:hypothetical protein
VERIPGRRLGGPRASLVDIAERKIPAPVKNLISAIQPVANSLPTDLC